MLQITLENVRTFGRKHDVPLRPLTIIVGENSSGKSTLLGAIAAMSNAETFPGQAGFNTPPFAFGGFGAIASIGPTEQSRAFGIGFSFVSEKKRRGELDLNVFATYRDEAGRPVISTLDVAVPGTELHLKRFSSSGNVRLELTRVGASRSSSVPQTTKLRARGKPVFPLSDLTFTSLFTVVSELARQRAVSTEEGSDEERLFNLQMEYMDAMEPLWWVTNAHHGIWGVVKSLAPIRTKPQRTYDVSDDKYVPEGDHIPYRLMRQAKKSRAFAGLSDFGKASGLFDSISIKRLGRDSSSPFQVQVGLAGETINLADVGYGVSQSLPIVAETLLTNSRTTLLVQQPEVHLHPRAQAALGTLFARAAADMDGWIILETHSDYLLDRIRQEIASGTISGSRVSLLFTERDGLSTTIHQIALDDMGNVVDPPSSYRAFFVDEELRLLTRGA